MKPRPPLPDYHVATHMAMLARQNQAFYKHARSHSYDGMTDYYENGVDVNEVLVDDGRYLYKNNDFKIVCIEYVCCMVD